MLSLHQHFSLPSGVVISIIRLQMIHLWFDKGNRGKPLVKVHAMTRLVKT